MCFFNMGNIEGISKKLVTSCPLSSMAEITTNSSRSLKFMMLKRTSSKGMASSMELGTILILFLGFMFNNETGDLYSMATLKANLEACEVCKFAVKNMVQSKLIKGAGNHWLGSFLQHMAPIVIASTFQSTFTHKENRW